MFRNWRKLLPTDTQAIVVQYQRGDTVIWRTAALLSLAEVDEMRTIVDRYIPGCRHLVVSGLSDLEILIERSETA